MGAHHFDIRTVGDGCGQHRTRQNHPPKEGNRELKMIYANGVEVVHGSTRIGRGNYFLRHRGDHLGGSRSLEIGP